MTTAIIGVGNIGKAVAQDLVNGGEEVVLASRKEADAAAVADGLGSRATAASTGKAIDAADVVVLAVWLDAMKEVIADHGAALAGKVVIDPSNPVAFNDKGEVSRTLPDGVSAASVIADCCHPTPTTSKHSERSRPLHSPPNRIDRHGR